MDEDWLLHKQNSKEEEEVIDKLEQVVRKWSSGTEEKDFFRSGEILQDDEEEVYFHFESSTKQEEIEEMKEQTNNKNGEERLPIREVRSIFAEDEDGLANRQNETTSNNNAVEESNNKENPPQLINAKLKPHLELTSSLSANSRRLPISVICERKRQSFYILAAFHKVSLDKIMLALSILPRIHLFLLRRQREIEDRTKFVRAFLDSILQDFVEISSTQHKFACMTVDNFNVGEGVVVPLFEQGLQEMLKNTKRLQLKILEQRSLVHSRLVEKLRRVDHMHSQAEIHLGNCDNRVKELVEFLARLRELFSKVQDMYEKTMSEDQASHVGNGDLEARGDVYRQAFKYGSCLRTIISETKRSAHMAFDLRDALIEKEIDTLRIVASVFKELKVFAQESMGPIAASSIEGAEPHFNKLGDPITTQRKYQLSRIFNDEECKLFHIDRKTIDEDVHKLEEALLSGLECSNPEIHFQQYEMEATVEGQHCRVGVSLDSHLSVIQANRLMVSLPLYKLDRDLTLENNTLTLSFQTKGLIFNTKQKLHIKFEHSHEAKVFQELLLSLLPSVS